MEGSDSQGTPTDSHGQPLDLGENMTTANLVKTEIAAPENQELYGQNTETYGDGATQGSLYPAQSRRGPTLPRPSISMGISLMRRRSRSRRSSCANPAGPLSLHRRLSWTRRTCGLTYAVHETGRHFLPNDPVYRPSTKPIPDDFQALRPRGGIYQAEQDLLDLQHKIFELAMHGALYRAPINSPNDVLDIATRTAIWAIHFLKEHPGSNLIGTDLSLVPM